MGEGLADVAGLAGEDVFERFLLGAEGLNLLLVEVQLLVHTVDGLLQSVDLTLQGRRVCCGINALGIHQRFG